MNCVPARSAALTRIATGFVEKKLTGKFFCHVESTRAACAGGYVVTCNNKNWYFKNTPLYKKEPFVCHLERQFSTEQDVQSMEFIKVSTETLESLSEYFDEIIEEAAHLQDADVSSGDGVLTVKFGSEYGTYVINRQVPNLQLWLSSPTSGPKRYDFIDGTWIYKHDGKSLHELLNEEIPKIVKSPVSFNNCSYGMSKK